MVDIKRRTDEVLIWQGDDLAHIKELRKRAEELADADPAAALLSEQSDAQAAAMEHDEFVAQAKERAVKVVIREIGRRRWRELLSAHPPREGNEVDQQMGVNEETFAEALVRASISEPMFTTSDDLDDFVDSLNAGVFEHIYVRAFTLNRSGVVDPKASLVSELMRKSDET